MDKEYILSGIRRTAEENGGRPLGRARFAAETGIRESDWTGRYWARWSDAVREAGFQPNALQGRYEDDAVLALLVTEIRRVGHLPTVPELRLRRREDKSFPSAGVFAKWGTRRQLASKLADYCQRRPGHGDVLRILQPLLDAEAPDDEEPGASGESEFGFVYLLKSGRHYKIGRTTSLERRERELAVQLAERAVRVHEIRTDDPIGIERYWHLRFADRRGNGEWFELTREDVRAFKRRKFM